MAGDPSVKGAKLGLECDRVVIRRGIRTKHFQCLKADHATNTDLIKGRIAFRLPVLGGTVSFAFLTHPKTDPGSRAYSLPAGNP